MKLLREIYKTLAGAQRRCGFENGIARYEFNHGHKARMYLYTVEQIPQGTWRVARRTIAKE